MTADVPQEKMNRQLVWHDEFESEKLDKTKWTFERLMDTPGNIYCNSEPNARLENSMLHLLVHKFGETYSLPESVTTKHTMLFRYGYVEMRAKIPFRHGAWPSFWLKGDTPYLRKAENRNNWFPEIDVFENFSNTSTIVANLHKWGRIDGNLVHEQAPLGEEYPNRVYRFTDADTVNDEFHIYGMLWTEKSVSFFVDGEAFSTIDISETSKLISDNYPDVLGFHDPMYLIINNEVFTEASSWKPAGSALTAEDKMPIDYYIDWVRLYQNENEKYFSKL